MMRQIARDLALCALVWATAVAFALLVVPGHGRLLPEAAPDAPRAECLRWRAMVQEREASDERHTVMLYCIEYGEGQ